VPDIFEWRGLSYAAGGDRGALTFPNLLSHYTRLVGMSYGRHPVLCVGEGEGCHPPSDGLNGAVSGSIATSLLGQAQGELHVPMTAHTDLVPRYKALSGRARAGWTYVNLAIGANDIVRLLSSHKVQLTPVRVLPLL
jgi:phospholipase B1